MIKKGISDSTVVVSSSVYVCEKCGHTEIARNSNESSKECPKCQANMNLVSSSSSAE